MMEISIQKARQRNSWHRTRYAFHEAGHAVVGHVIGRCIAEVSAISNRGEGYKGYCAFDPFMESANNHLQWQKESRNPELITILYAGTIVMSMVCQDYGWKYEHWRGCDKVDFDAIFLLS